MWKKNISLKDARKISEIFCKDFEIEYCQIFYVDDLGKNLGFYCRNPSHILIEDSKRNKSKIGVLMHELTHHIEFEIYGTDFNDPVHGYKYQLAKEKVVSWCRKNISDKPNWYVPLKSRANIDEQNAFKI